MLACGGGLFAAYRYGTNTTKVDVQVAKARTSEFTISVRTRGEVRSVHSQILTAPQVPDPRIVQLAESGKPIKKGDVVMEFDAAQQEQTYLEKNTSVRTADSEIVQMKATQQINNEMDSMNLMTSEYNVERAKLEASKAEVLSEIEGAKNRIDVGVSEGDLSQVKTTMDVAQDWQRGRHGTPRPEERQDGSRCRPGQGLSFEDGAARAERRHREHSSELPQLRFVRVHASAIQRRR